MSRSTVYDVTVGALRSEVKVMKWADEHDRVVLHRAPTQVKEYMHDAREDEWYLLRDGLTDKVNDRKVHNFLDSLIDPLV